jgi:hypothetical protein
MKPFAVIAVTVALACSSFALAQETRKSEEAGPSLWDRTYEQSWEMYTNGPATLALVGWYLIVPPPYYIGIGMANWQRRGVFDNKAQCQSARLNLIQHPPGDVDVRGYFDWNYPQCVSSDDPRLSSHETPTR